MALKLVVAAILASPKHRAFTWSYRSGVYRVHCCRINTNKEILQLLHGYIFRILQHFALFFSFKSSLLSNRHAMANCMWLS